VLSVTRGKDSITHRRGLVRGLLRCGISNQSLSAKGQNRPPSRHGAFPIADILARVGSVAKADVAERPSSANTGREQVQQKIVLLNDLIGAAEHRRGHVEAERLGGLEINDKLVFGRQLNG
jgi:hypothetical protein